MDSITQIVLGSAVAEATLGHKIGRKAALYGAALGTLPDLDVLWVKNAVESFTEHRSFSHSIIVLLLASPLFAYCLQRWHPKDLSGNKISFRYWAFSIFLILGTHAVLDAFTIYGTQLFWPITNYPYGAGSVFIIDPLYTLPLLLCLLVTLFSRNRKAVLLGLIISCSYLAWSLVAQNLQSDKFTAALKQQNIEYTKSLTIATPFNTLLWQNIALTDDGYWITFNSVLDNKNEQIKSKFIANETKKLAPIYDSPMVHKLRDFTKGYYQIKQQDINNQQHIVLSDLRMGSFGNFVFNFTVGKVIPAEVNNGELGKAKKNSQTIAIESTDIIKLSNRPNKQDLNLGLKLIWQRIFDPTVNLFSLFKD